MDKQSSYAYIILGLILRMLINAPGTWKKASVFEEIAKLSSFLRDLQFPVTLSYLHCSDFDYVIDQIVLLKDDEPIGDVLAKYLAHQATHLEKVLFAEANIRSVYVIPSRRFNSDYLLNAPEKLFKGGLFAALTPITQQDVTSSCRCILFGEATAAAFHILRATESALRSYYFLHRKQNRLEKPMWANMVEQLRAKKRQKPSKALLDSLDMIRGTYRNPTQHPEMSYEIDGAQDLFGVCIDVIGKMASEFR